MSFLKTILGVRNRPDGSNIQLWVDEARLPGELWFVLSGVGEDDEDRGRVPDQPMASIAYALTQAAPGDIILCLPGHAETISTAAGINANVAGISIVGVGHRGIRPVITMDNTAATFAIAATGVRLENLKFIADAAVVIGVDVNSSYAKIVNCEFVEGGDQFTTAIDVNGGAANACDGTEILGCEFNSPTAGAGRAIELGEVADRVVIKDCLVWGDYDDAPIHNPTGKVLTRLTISGCHLQNTQTGDHSIELVSACTGALIRNTYDNNMTQATGVDPGSCKSFECYHCDTIDVSGILAPVAT